MKINAEGVALIKSSEACRLLAYRCPGGRWTIGYGHAGPEVHAGMTIDQVEADALFQADLLKFDAFVKRTCPAATVAQHSAMVSLCFNIGCEAFAHSSVARLHNSRRYAEAAQAFALWNESRGVVMAGLVARRAAEATLYLSDAPGYSSEDPSREVIAGDAQGEKPLRSSRTITGGAIAATATGSTIAVDGVRDIDGWRSAVDGLIPYFDEARWILLALTIAGILVVLYARCRDRREGRA